MISPARSAREVVTTRRAGASADGLTGLLSGVSSAIGGVGDELRQAAQSIA